MSPYKGCVAQAKSELSELMTGFLEFKDYPPETKAKMIEIARRITSQTTITAAGEERDIAVIMHGRSSLGTIKPNLGFLTWRQLTTGATRGTCCVTVIGDVTYLVNASSQAKQKFTSLARLRNDCFQRQSCFNPKDNEDTIATTIKDLTEEGLARWLKFFPNMKPTVKR